ncbi:MAG TPA: PIG-L deacetylase family protein [Micromonosporaceae bacterium]|nr:PIG-L deacetylase family protein [Micromonosporaceae bacterium]
MGFPPSPEPIDDAKRVLCVAAHPDDIDFGFAGTVAGFVAAGLHVTYLLVTRGDAGGFDDTPREQMPLLREAEQRAAATAVGVEDLIFLDGYRDGTITVTLELRRDISRVIRQVRPDRILTNSPMRRWDRIGAGHPDHLAVAEATTCAVYPDARNAFAFPELLADEGLEPWTVREMWFVASPNPDHFVDITDVYPRKLAALQAHATQTSHIDLDERLRTMLGNTAKEGRLADGRLAESFSIIRTG